MTRRREHRFAKRGGNPFVGKLGVGDLFSNSLKRQTPNNRETGKAKGKEQFPSQYVYSDRGSNAAAFPRYQSLLIPWKKSGSNAFSNALKHSSKEGVRTRMPFIIGVKVRHMIKLPQKTTESKLNQRASVSSAKQTNPKRVGLQSCKQKEASNGDYLHSIVHVQKEQADELRVDVQDIFVCWIVLVVRIFLPEQLRTAHCRVTVAAHCERGKIATCERDRMT